MEPPDPDPDPDIVSEIRLIPARTPALNRSD
jgi:hypothetical protein